MASCQTKAVRGSHEPVASTASGAHEVTQLPVGQKSSFFKRFRAAEHEVTTLIIGLHEHGRHWEEEQPATAHGRGRECARGRVQGNPSSKTRKVVKCTISARYLLGGRSCSVQRELPSPVAGPAQRKEAAQSKELTWSC